VVGGQLKDCSDFNVLHEEVKGDRFKNKDVPTVASCLHMDAGSTSTEQHEHSYVHQLEASINCLSCYHQSFSLQLLVSQPTSMLEEAQWSPILYFFEAFIYKRGLACRFPDWDKYVFFPRYCVFVNIEHSAHIQLLGIF